VPLSNVASLVPATGPTKIERYNRVRQIMITGNIAKGGSLSEALALLESTVQEMTCRRIQRRTRWTQQGTGRAAKNYGIALLLSLIFMYMISRRSLKASSIHHNSAEPALVGYRSR